MRATLILPPQKWQIWIDGRQIHVWIEEDGIHFRETLSGVKGVKPRAEMVISFENALSKTENQSELKLIYE